MGDLMGGEMVSHMRWLKTRMKWVIVLVEKRIELIEKMTSIDFCIYDH
jgi:hypothetical protein